MRIDGSASSTARRRAALAARQAGSHSARGMPSASARVSLGYLSEVERGRKEASSELLAAICAALETPLSQVFREVSDNFALSELQNDPVLVGALREPGLRILVERPAGRAWRRGGPRGGRPARRRPRRPRPASLARRRLGDPEKRTAGDFPRSRPQLSYESLTLTRRLSYSYTQAWGLSVRTATAGGSSPDTMSASVTVSSTARSFARSAIHTRCSGSGLPWVRHVLGASSPRTPRELPVDGADDVSEGDLLDAGLAQARSRRQGRAGCARCCRLRLRCVRIVSRELDLGCFCAWASCSAVMWPSCAAASSMAARSA